MIHDEPQFDLEGAFPIDIDFETYEVPKDKADLIRRDLETIKTKTWLGDLFSWVKEKGDDFQISEQSDLIDGQPAKKLNWPADHILFPLELILDGTILEIKTNTKSFLVLQQFPKSEEILVSQFNPEQTQAFNELEIKLQEELKLYAKAKSEKTKQLSDKLAGLKKSPPVEPSNPT
jgi:hypothetical protein